MVFAGQLARAKRAGLGEYGVLAQRYVREFDAKWVRGARDPAEPLVGSADIQSLADLANSFDVIRTMRFVPFSKETVFQLGVVTLVPLLPLLLTMISLEELLKTSVERGVLIRMSDSAAYEMRRRRWVRWWMSLSKSG